jgi:TRAP-type C4-dicarboxylate transport system permease small subunit
VKVIKSLSQAMNYVAMGLVVVLTLLTVADVFLRFAFNRPITGTTEMTLFIMVCLVLGVAWCGLRGRHVSVDLVMSRFPPRVQAITDSITFFIGLVVSIIITWRALVESFWELRFKYTGSSVFPVPTFPFWWLYTLGWFMLCIVLAALVIQKVTEAIRR